MLNKRLIRFDLGTKLERADDLGLPPRKVIIRRDLFNEEEEEVYDSLYSDTVRRFNTYVEAGTVLNNYANIFELLTRMRQAVNHPELLRVNKRKDTLVCGICSDEVSDAMQTMYK
jgi:DNA repair protein RAD16